MGSTQSTNSFTFTFQLPYCSSICCYCIISHRLLLHVTIAAAVQDYCRQVLLGCDRLAQHLTNYHQTILQIISVSNTDYLQTLFLSLSLSLINYTICYMNPYFKKEKGNTTSSSPETARSKSPTTKNKGIKLLFFKQ